MAMMLSALRAAIAAAENGSLAISTEALGIDDVATLFTTYLPGGTLSLGSSKPGADGLSATGTLVIGGVSSASATVQFLPDPTWQLVAGIVVTLPLPSWQIDLPFTTLHATTLAARGVTHPRLVLRAGVGAATPVAQITGDLALTALGVSSATEIAAHVPEAASLPLSYQFTARPVNLTLPDLGPLSGLLGGVAIELPLEIPLASSLSLTQVEYVVDPIADALSSLRLDVESRLGLDLIPDILSIETFRLGFLALYPGRSSDVTVLAEAALSVHGVDVDIMAILPDLTFQGALSHDTPVRLDSFLSRFLPFDSLFDDLMLSQFDVSFGLRAPYPYAFSLEVDGHIGVTLGPTRLELQQITLEMSGQGADPPALSFGGRFDLGGVALYMRATRGTDGWTFSGSPDGGMRLAELAGALFANSIQVPAALDPSFGGFSLSISPSSGAFHFTASSGEPWAILDDALVIDRLSLDVSGGSGAGRTTGSLGGEVTIAGLTVELTASLGQTGVRFSGATKTGQTVSLTALAGHLLGPIGTLPAEVPDVAIGDLALAFDTADKSFAFHGASSAEWPLTIAGKAVSMAVAVDVARGAGAAKPTVTLTGSFTIGSTTFTIAHTVGAATLVARWGDLELDLSRDPHGGYTVKLRSLPLGEALARLVAMADPNFTLALESPWDRLASFTLPEIELTVDATAHIVGFSCPMSIDLGVGTISGIGARFEKGKSVIVDVQGSFLGQTLPTWDLVNQPPPALPSAAPRALDVRYLGLGQHVALTTTSDLTSVGKVIEALRNVPVAQDPTTSLHDLKFDASAGWLIGFDLSIKGAISVAAIFNDPALYGLKISLSGDLVGKLAGLSFEILYRKIADGLGLYHIDLLLPLLMRHLQFGSVSLTLPHIIVDIYTNGNFLVDFGFPYERDFSRSMMIEVFPFVGAGGFYFGVLDSSTSNLVPTAQVGAFQPVIAFGLGLQVGLGKTFEAGPLSAGITITVEGILEGVLAFWKHGDASETYFKLSGTVAISAHVWGSVDFVIVSASIDIYVFAAVQLVIESHRPIFLELSAGVSVSASARVCGLFTVHFHFSTTIHESFTIGSTSDAPWQQLS